MPSSVIRHHAYDAARQVLDVTFVTGRRYLYHDVPPDTAIGLGAASSKGRYFNARIRDVFAFTEVA
ncbi:KTSC domain-containing protein [Allosphingosinicella indica]|nr:KTSC domain-containing protein [Allosphingosinicella indica]